jgi:hypothetical protein
VSESGRDGPNTRNKARKRRAAFCSCSQWVPRESEGLSWRSCAIGGGHPCCSFLSETTPRIARMRRGCLQAETPQVSGQGSSAMGGCREANEIAAFSRKTCTKGAWIGRPPTPCKAQRDEVRTPQRKRKLMDAMLPDIEYFPQEPTTAWRTRYGLWLLRDCVFPLTTKRAWSTQRDLVGR